MTERAPLKGLTVADIVWASSAFVGSIIIIHQTLLGFVATSCLGKEFRKMVKLRSNTGVSIPWAERRATLAAFHSTDDSPGL